MQRLEGHTDVSGRLILGWEEWVALPLFGLPAIKAKIDTGARTSALHAEAIEVADEAGREHVRFTIRPSPRRPELIVACSAPIMDRRRITSSNGAREERFVLVTELEIGGTHWPIEITLSDRTDMSYRMLLGRQALQAGNVVVDPTRSFVLPRLKLSLYRPKLRRTGTPTREVLKHDG